MTNNLFPARALVFQPVDALKVYSDNARKHSKHQVHQVAASIKAFGFTNPVLIDHKNTIIAGHGRVEVAKLLGINDVPIIHLEGLNDDQIRAYIIADTRLAEKAGWDQSILVIELQHLLTINSNFDVTITGFEILEIDLIIEEGGKKKSDKDDLFQIDETSGPITQCGDIWALGKHRLLCGSSLEEASFKSLMATRRASVVFVDPPYNVAIDGNVCGNGSIRHREFAMTSGELNEAEFVSFLARSLRLLARYSANDSIHFIFTDGGISGSCSPRAVKPTMHSSISAFGSLTLPEKRTTKGKANPRRPRVLNARLKHET